MGKKYIVELKKNETLYKAATRESDGTAYVCSAIGTPYTEPNTESIRKEAYEQGINDAREGKASCQFCRFTDVRQDMEPCASCSNNYDNKFEPEEQEEMDGLRQNIQTIVDQCGYTLDEIASVLQKMRES